MWYKEKTIEIDNDTLKAFQKQLGEKIGRASEEDVDKNLEKKLCEIFFSTETNNPLIEEATFEEDYKKDIDCIVDGLRVQVKCRTKKIIYLETEKIRNSIEYQGWTKRSIADIFLFAYPHTSASIKFIRVGGSVLKEMLQELENCSDPSYLDFCRKWNVTGVVYKKNPVEMYGDSKGSYYEVHF